MLSLKDKIVGFFSAFLGLSLLALPQDYHPLDLDKSGKPLKLPSSFPPQSRLWNQKSVEEHREKVEYILQFQISVCIIGFINILQDFDKQGVSTDTGIKQLQHMYSILRDHFHLFLVPSQSAQTHGQLGLEGFSIDGCSSGSKGFVSQICAVIQWYPLLQKRVMLFTEVAKNIFMCVLSKYYLLIRQKSCSICTLDHCDISHTWEQVKAISRSILYFMLSEK